MTGRDEHKIHLIETYLKRDGIFRNANDPDPFYSGASLVLDLSTIRPSVAGPKRPHDKVNLSDVKEDFDKSLCSPAGFKGYNIPPENLNAKS